MIADVPRSGFLADLRHSKGVSTPEYNEYKEPYKDGARPSHVISSKSSTLDAASAEQASAPPSPRARSRSPPAPSLVAIVVGEVVMAKWSSTSRKAKKAEVREIVADGTACILRFLEYDDLSPPIPLRAADGRRVKPRIDQIISHKHV